MKQTIMLQIPKFICDLYLYVLINSSKLPSKDFGLKDDSDKSNVIYVSKRSNFKYIYLQSTLVLVLNRLIMWYLKFRTGIEFGGINELVAPINIYSLHGEIKPHRDRNMLDGTIPLYIACLCLKDGYKGGSFYYNTHGVSASKDGKFVKDLEKYRVYKKLKKGQILILRNDNSIHGTLRVTEGLRITTGFRSK